jgi:hypothetical protein
MTNDSSVSIKDLISSAVKACRAFAKCSENFFNFEKTNIWRGWENWLTVDIARRLNRQSVVPFARYSECRDTLKTTMDLLVTRPNYIAVEIKVNYWGDDDIRRCGEEKKPLPERAIKDIEKLRKAGSDVRKVFMISTVFESRQGLMKYRKRVLDRDQKVLKELNWKWYDCSASRNGGHNLLLVISDIQRLPEI